MEITQKRRDLCNQSKVIGESWIILFMFFFQLITQLKEKYLIRWQLGFFIQQSYQPKILSLFPWSLLVLSLVEADSHKKNVLQF